MDVENSRQCLKCSWLMANTIVERGRCLDAVVKNSICESSSDPISMRSTITDMERAFKDFDDSQEGESSRRR